MSRFDNLEFERPKGEARGPARGDGTGTPIRDSAHFRQVAGEEYRQGKLETALRTYSRALECDTAVSECWLMQVRILIELDEYKEADVWADKALEMFPDHPDLLSAKAVLNARTGMIDRAMALSDSAMSRKGCSAYAWLARAEVLLSRRGRMASECLTRAVAECRDPADRAWMNVEVARVLRRNGRCSEALFHAITAQAAMPRYASVALEVGLCREALGLPEAGTAFQEALHLDPLCDEARRRLARWKHPGFWASVKRLFGWRGNGT